MSSDYPFRSGSSQDPENKPAGSGSSPSAPTPSEASSGTFSDISPDTSSEASPGNDSSSQNDFSPESAPGAAPGVTNPAGETGDFTGTDNEKASHTSVDSTGEAVSKEPELVLSSSQKTSAASKNSPYDRSEREELVAPEIMPQNLYSRVFSFLSFLPFVWLLLILAAQTIFSLDARELWFSDEVRHGNAFQNLLAHGKWVILEMNGQPYPDKPPLYFLFLQGIHYFLQVEGPRLYLAAAAISGALYLMASLALGKMVAGVDKRTRFASGLILLLCGYVYGTMHYARMDLLFSAFIIMAHVFMYKALTRERATACMLGSFFFAALAVLTKGPLGIILPLVSGLFFTLWLGRPKRFFSRDTLAGILLFAILTGLWVGAVIWETGGLSYFTNEILGRQVAERAVKSFAHRESWYYYLTRVPLAWLPWTLIILFLPWHRLFGAGMRKAVAEARTPKKDGLAYLWIMCISGLLVLTASSGKIVIYFLPVFPAMAILTARAIFHMTRLPATGFRWAVALFLLVAALAVIWASLVLSGAVAPPDIKGIRPWPPIEQNAGFIIAAILLFAFAWMAFGLRSSRPEGVLLVLLVTNLAFTYPLCNMLAPAFDPIMSPKGQAEVLKSFTDQGYYPASYREYSGTWTYYSGVNTDMLKSVDGVLELLKTHDRLIFGTRGKDWDKWTDKPQELKVVDRRWIAEAEWVLAAWPVTTDGRPVPKGQPADQPAPGGQSPADLPDPSTSLPLPGGLDGLWPGATQPLPGTTAHDNNGNATLSSDTPASTNQVPSVTGAVAPEGTPKTDGGNGTVPETNAETAPPDVDAPALTEPNSGVPALDAPVSNAPASKASETISHPSTNSSLPTAEPLPGSSSTTDRTLQPATNATGSSPDAGSTIRLPQSTPSKTETIFMPWHNGTVRPTPVSPSGPSTGMPGLVPGADGVTKQSSGTSGQSANDASAPKAPSIGNLVNEAGKSDFSDFARNFPAVNP